MTGTIVADTAAWGPAQAAGAGATIFGTDAQGYEVRFTLQSLGSILSGASIGIPNAGLIGGNGAAFTTVTIGSGLSLSSGILTATGGGGGSVSQATNSALGIVRGGGLGNVNINADGSITAPSGGGGAIYTGSSPISISGSVISLANGSATGQVWSWNGSAWALAIPSANGTPIAFSTTYTASGAITVPTTQMDVMAIVNSASVCDMTLGAGVNNGQVLNIKRYGSGTVNITLNLDGISGTMLTANSSTIKENMIVAWNAALSTWLSV